MKLAQNPPCVEWWPGFLRVPRGGNTIGFGEMSRVWAFTVATWHFRAVMTVNMQTDRKGVACQNTSACLLPFSPLSRNERKFVHERKKAGSSVPPLRAPPATMSLSVPTPDVALRPCWWPCPLGWPPAGGAPGVDAGNLLAPLDQVDSCLRSDWLDVAASRQVQTRALSASKNRRLFLTPGRRENRREKNEQSAQERGGVETPKAERGWGRGSPQESSGREMPGTRTDWHPGPEVL